MAIKYSLRKNVLTTSNNGDYVAQVHSVQRLSQQNIAERISDRGSSLTLADINGVLLLLSEVCTQAVASGASVTLDGLVEISPTIKGTFHGCEDGFDRSRHTLSATASPTVSFKTAISQRATVEKHEAGDHSPSVTTIFDLATGSNDATLTAGNIAEVMGYRLKFDTERTDEGVFLISEDGADTRRVEFVYHNKPRKLVFLVPTGLTASTYFVEVCARSNPNGPVRAERFGTPLAYA